MQGREWRKAPLRLKPMTKVYITKKNGMFFLDVEGHAGYSEEGEDILCASLSMLTYTFAQIVQNYEREMIDKSTIILEKGNAHIFCYPKMDIRKEIKAALDTVTVGFKLLEFNFPDYVSLQID